MNNFLGAVLARLHYGLVGFKIIKAYVMPLLIARRLLHLMCLPGAFACWPESHLPLESSLHEWYRRTGTSRAHTLRGPCFGHQYSTAPLYKKDPKRDPNLDNYPSCSGAHEPASQDSLQFHDPDALPGRQLFLELGF